MVAIRMDEIKAAITAAGIPAADAAGIWPAARAARDGAPRGTPEATRRSLAITAAIVEVSARTPALLPAFSAALTAPSAPATPAPPPTPAATPATPAPPPTPVPPQFADAVDRALRAAGVTDAAQRAERGGDFADAWAAGRGLEEAKNRLFENLDPAAEQRGRLRFEGLHESRWRKVKEAALGLVSSRAGLLQLALLVIAVLVLSRAPVPAKIILVPILIAFIWANLWFSHRGALIVANMAFVAFLLAMSTGLFSGVEGNGGTTIINVRYVDGVGDSSPVATIPPD